MKEYTWLVSAEGEEFTFGFSLWVYWMLLGFFNLLNYLFVLTICFYFLLDSWLMLLDSVKDFRFLLGLSFFIICFSFLNFLSNNSLLSLLIISFVLFYSIRYCSINFRNFSLLKLELNILNKILFSNLQQLYKHYTR